MGARANVYVQESDPSIGVYLYTHWGGYDLPSVVKAALESEAGMNRHRDGQYLTRIIFDKMTEGHHGEETGFGISAAIGDNGYPIIVLCPDTGLFRFAPEGQEKEPLTVENAEPFRAMPEDWPEL